MRNLMSIGMYGFQWLSHRISPTELQFSNRMLISIFQSAIRRNRRVPPLSLSFRLSGSLTLASVFLWDRTVKDDYSSFMLCFESVLLLNSFCLRYTFYHKKSKSQPLKVKKNKFLRFFRSKKPKLFLSRCFFPVLFCGWREFASLFLRLLRWGPVRFSRLFTGINRFRRTFPVSACL